MRMTQNVKQVLKKLYESEIPIPKLDGLDETSFLAGVQWLGIYIKAVAETGRFDFTVEQLDEIGGLSNEEV